jgi:Cu2+-exporting ATPase
MAVVLVGSNHFIAEDEGIDCSLIEEQSVVLRQQGNSLLYVSRNQTLLGVLVLSDQVRPEAENVLKKLKQSGIKKIVVLTGDHIGGANFLKEKLPGLDEVHAELKPEDKARIVNQLKEQGYKTAFVGDGVNDAPALVNADVGICMHGGADLARESAQVILLKDDLNALWAARDVADKTSKVLENCFAGAVGVNSLILLLATSGFLPAAVSATLHNAATVGLLGYAAAGKRYTGEK